MEQPKYFPFADGQWRIKTGLTALRLQEWIEIDDNFARDLAFKHQLLASRYLEVFASLTGSETGQKEVLDLLLGHLLDYFPQHYRRQGKKLENLVTGQIWDIAEFTAAPLNLAGRLVQEDLCLMRPSPEGYVLAAASVCFPSHWSLPEKLGRTLAGIHQPIPRYHGIERPVNRFFEHLQPDKPVWRMNWGIVDSPELFLAQKRPHEAVLPTINAANAGERLWLRVERQTLRRLEQSGDILFTIRTYVHPLRILESNLAMAGNLAAAIKQMPSDVQSYKNLLPIREAVLNYLSKIGGI